MAIGGPWVSRSGGWFDGISCSPLRNAAYRATLASRNIGLSCVSTFSLHQSVPLLECPGPHAGFDTASSLKYTAILSSLPVLLPPPLPFRLPRCLLTIPLSPLPPCHSSLPLHRSPPVFFPNRHVTTVGHSLPTRIVELTPIICVFFAYAVDGRRRGLLSSKECSIDPNHSSLIMPTFISSIQSPAVVRSGAIAWHHSCRKSGQRENPSGTEFVKPGMCFTSNSKYWRTVSISICRMVRRGCVRIQRNVIWSVCTNNGCSAPGRLDLQYNIVSQMPNSTLSYAGYHVSTLCNWRLKYPTTISALSCTWESTAPNAYCLASTCRQ